MRFCPNQDSLDQARQKVTNYSSSEGSNVNQIKTKLHRTPCRKQSKTISESESDSDVTSNIPLPPDLTDKNVSVNKISNIFNSSAENNLDFDILEGTIISHKSNGLF